MRLIVSIYFVTVVPMHDLRSALSYISAAQQTKNLNKFWFWVVNVRIIQIFPQINITHTKVYFTFIYDIK